MKKEIPVWIRAVGHSNDGESNESWIVLGWMVDGIGVGELTLTYDRDKNAWTAQTETMSKDFVKKILYEIVDKATITDTITGTPIKENKDGEDQNI